MTSPFMARAIQLAIENVRSGQGGPFGAVIVKDGNVIAEGANSVTAANDPTAHAEVVAIRQACQKLGLFELKNCDLYTSCEPCPCAWARSTGRGWRESTSPAWRWMRLKLVLTDFFIYREIAKSHAARGIPMIQMMREEALAAFRAWAEKPNKIPY